MGSAATLKMANNLLPYSTINLSVPASNKEPNAVRIAVATHQFATTGR